MARIVEEISVALITLCATASHAFEVCRVPCAADDAACRAAVALCEVKIDAFDAYMDRIDTGQTQHALPSVYRDILRPHYPQVDLGAVRFAFSDQQPPDNATTDCNRIYFNNQSYVNLLRDSAPNPNYHWLLHELEHAEQCAAAGSRERYAKRWWEEIEKALLESGEGLNLNPFQTREQLVKQLQSLYLRVHGSMPMEQSADAKAEAVLADLRRCCIAAGGTPVRPPRHASDPGGHE